MTTPEPGAERAEEQRDETAEEQRGERAEKRSELGDKRSELEEKRSEQRPRPQYGELAPEGWSWNPEGQERGTSSGETAQTAAPGSSAATGAGAGAGAKRGTAASSGPLPGVPHNLGARSQGLGSAGRGREPERQPLFPQGSRTAPSNTERSSTERSSSGQESTGRAGTGQATQQRTNAPYRDDRSWAARGADPAGVVARPNRVADRIITIALLVLGAYGALSSAASLQGLAEQLSMIGSALDVEDFVVPDSVRTLGTVGAIIVLALYAVNLILSIQRMRAAKLAFWVPLVTALVAFIVTFAFVSFGLNQAPELATRLLEPDALETLLYYLTP